MKTSSKKIAVLASGNGSNLQAIIDHKTEKFEVALVLSNVKTAFALQRASKANIPAFYVSKTDRDKKIFSHLEKHKIDLVVLAGYLKKVGDNILEDFKVINIHPSLLPKHGGPGMFGINVHQAVIESKEKQSGATVHYVTGVYDEGEIIIQEKVDVLDDDTPESLAKRVLEVEHRIFIEGIELALRGS